MKHMFRVLVFGVGVLMACGSEEPVTRVSEAQDSIRGRGITEWTEAWFRWNFAVLASENPALSLDADCSTGQSEPVFFVPAYEGAKTYERTCHIPANTPRARPPVGHHQ